MTFQTVFAIFYSVYSRNHPPPLTNPETCKPVRTADSADDLSFIRVIPSQILISGCPLLEFLPVITL